MDRGKVGQKRVRREVDLLRKGVAILLIISMIGAVVPLFIRTLGIYFLPSPDYYTNVELYSFIIAALLGIFMFFILFSGEFAVNSGGGILHSIMGRPGFILSTAGFVAFVFYTSEMFFVPMVLAVVAGEETSIVYTVRDVSAGHRRGCPYPIELRRMPWFLGEACSTREFRENVEPGMQLILSGWGTDYGLFYDKIEILAEPQK